MPSGSYGRQHLAPYWPMWRPDDNCTPITIVPINYCSILIISHDFILHFVRPLYIGFSSFVKRRRDCHPSKVWKLYPIHIDVPMNHCVWITWKVMLAYPKREHFPMESIIRWDEAWIRWLTGGISHTYTQMLSCCSFRSLSVAISTIQHDFDRHTTI